MTEHENRFRASSGDSAFGSFGKTLQVLFDESIIDANVVHETWSHAWGRAISYAWQSEENKQRLLNFPVEVLAEFNYSLPSGVSLRVIEANEASEITLTREKGDLTYNSGNLTEYKSYLIDVSTIENTEKTASNGSNQVQFKLHKKDEKNYFANTLISDISPVNGWIDLPEEGVIARHSSDRLWWVTKKELSLDSWPSDEVFNAPMLDQFTESGPEFFRLASTIVMTLPPQPEDETQTTMALNDYDALGKIYPFTS